MEHQHLMELIGAFLTGVVGPILYLVISKIQLARVNKKRDRVKEAILDIAVVNCWLALSIFPIKAGEKKQFMLARACCFFFSVLNRSCTVCFAGVGVVSRYPERPLA